MPIGQGAGGIVYIAQSTLIEDLFVAVKKITAISEKQHQAVKEEIKILELVGEHPNVLSLREHFYDMEECTYYLVT
jgi:hypothetical protein